MISPEGDRRAPPSGAFSVSCGFSEFAVLWVSFLLLSIYLAGNRVNKARMSGKRDLPGSPLRGFPRDRVYVRLLEGEKRKS